MRRNNQKSFPGFGNRLEIRIPNMPRWKQISGDMDPGKYGGIIARSDGDALELIQIQNVRELVGDGEAEEVGFPFWSKEASYDLDDLNPDRKEVQQAMKSRDFDLDDLEEMDPPTRALAIAEILMEAGYSNEGNGGWSDDIIHDEVEWWGKDRQGNPIVEGAAYIADEDESFRSEILGEGDDEDEDEDDDELNENPGPGYGQVYRQSRGPVDIVVRKIFRQRKGDSYHVRVLNPQFDEFHQSRKAVLFRADEYSEADAVAAAEEWLNSSRGQMALQRLGQRVEAPRHPDIRMQPGGDLYQRPLTRQEMTAPLTWAEKQMAVCRRYGVLADGTIGFEVVGRSGMKANRGGDSRSRGSITATMSPEERRRFRLQKQAASQSRPARSASKWPEKRKWSSESHSLRQNASGTNNLNKVIYDLLSYVDVDGQVGETIGPPYTVVRMIRDGSSIADEIETYAKKMGRAPEISKSEAIFLRTKAKSGVLIFEDEEHNVQIVYYDNNTDLDQDWAEAETKLGGGDFTANPSPYRYEIIDGAARGFFVSSWADAAEEAGHRFGGGTKLEDAAPATPDELKAFAQKFIVAVERLNGAHIGRLYEEHRDMPEEQHSRDPAPEDFGFSLAMQGLGDGVSWYDYHPVPKRGEIKLPHVEVLLEVDANDIDDVQISYLSSL